MGESGASCRPAVRLRLLILNTENTKNPRSFTEKGDIALRAKRLKSPDGANGRIRLLPPEIFVDSSCSLC